MSQIFQKVQGPHLHSEDHSWYSFYQTVQSVSEGVYYCLHEHYSQDNILTIKVLSCAGDKCSAMDMPLFMLHITNNLDFLYLQHIGIKDYRKYKEYCELRGLPLVLESQLDLLLKESGATLSDWIKLMTDLSERHGGTMSDQDSYQNSFLSRLPQVPLSDEEGKYVQHLIDRLVKAEGSGEIADAKMFLGNKLKEHIVGFVEGQMA